MLATIIYLLDGIFSETCFRCDGCQKTFPNKSKLYGHSRFCMPKKWYPCQYCSMTLKTSQRLRAHERQHTGERPYICEFCSATFGDQSSFCRHRKKCKQKFGRELPVEEMYVSNPESEDEDDQSAEEHFLIKSNAQSMDSTSDHIKANKTANAHECELCSKTFPKKWRLIIHMRSHTGERPLSCPTCEKTFSDPSSFCRHKKRCPYCPREDKTNQSHNNHAENQPNSSDIGDESNSIGEHFN